VKVEEVKDQLAELILHQIAPRFTRICGNYAKCHFQHMLPHRSESFEIKRRAKFSKLK